MDCSCPSPTCPVAALKRALAVAAGVAHRHPATALAEPLFPRADGCPTSKAGMVSLFKHIARCAGAPVAQVTGHSARVAGAQRMALAGVHIWVVQLFGRRGSSAVLRYAREALLGSRGGGLARATAAGGDHTLDEIKSRVARFMAPPAQAASGSGKQQPISAGAVTAVVERIAKETFPRMAPAAVELKAALSGLEALDRRVSEIAPVIGMIQQDCLRPYVQCPGGRLHVPADNAYTRRGWAWRRGEGVPRLTRTGAGAGPVRKTCARTRT